MKHKWQGAFPKAQRGAVPRAAAEGALHSVQLRAHKLPLDLPGLEDALVWIPRHKVHARSARALHRSVVGGTAKQDDKPSRRFCQLRQRERLSLEAGQLLNAGKLFKDTSEAGFEAPTEGEAGFEAGFVRGG